MPTLPGGCGSPGGDGPLVKIGRGGRGLLAGLVGLSMTASVLTACGSRQPESQLEAAFKGAGGSVGQVGLNGAAAGAAGGGTTTAAGAVPGGVLSSGPALGAHATGAGATAGSTGTGSGGTLAG